jgi:hypothetical protein
MKKSLIEPPELDVHELDVLDFEETAKANLVVPYRWGSDSRGHAIRAKGLLGWKPTQPGLLELLPHIVDIEAA